VGFKSVFMGYFASSFSYIIVEVSNFEANLHGDFKLLFVMVEVTNLDSNLGSYLMQFSHWQRSTILC
jgi:hypothetical protein